VKRADRVLDLFKATNYASEQDIIAMLNGNVIKNCPLTADDVRIFFRIYGGLEGAIKGKTTRKTPQVLNVEENTTSVPRSIKEENSQVVLSIDIFFIQGSPFFTSISRNLMFTTASTLKNRKKAKVYKAIQGVIGFYAMHDYYVKTVLADNEFGTLKEKLMNEEEVDLNLGAPKQHIPEVERNIRVIKERLRAVINSMPYEYLPSNFKTELVLACVVTLNMIPRQASVSPAHSPWGLITGRSIDYNKHFRLAPGVFCMVHEENAPTNSMDQRALEAIAIGPCTSLYGSYRFLSLVSGRIIRRRDWTTMTITNRIVTRVEELANGEDKHIEFEYDGVSFSTSEALGQLHNTADPLPIEEPSVAEEVEVPPIELDDGDNDDPPSDGESANSSDEDDHDDDEIVPPPEEDENEEAEPATLLKADTVSAEPARLDAHASEPGGPAIRTRAGRQQSGRKDFYEMNNHADGTESTTTEGTKECGDQETATTTKSKECVGECTVWRPEPQFEDDYIIGDAFLNYFLQQKQGCCFTQMSLSKGLEAFGEEAEDAVMAEFQQFHRMDVLRPVFASALTALEK
jgi:hypothetical protein